MKKKSPPYAIIGAVVLGIIAVMAYFSHERAVRAQAEADLAKARADAQALIDQANQRPVAPVVQETQTHMRGVLYATQPIDPGVRINPSFFEVKQTPEGVLPDAYTDKNNDDVIGSFAVRSIEKGDPLTPRNVGKTLPMMSGRIAPGMRMVSLPVFNADDNSTGGFIVDGDRVDLLCTEKTETGDYLIKTETVLQNLPVLYVPGPPPTTRTEKTQGLNPAPSPGAAIAVSFEVTPEQAQALIFMQSIKNCKFYMILRSRRDNTQIKIKPFEADTYAGNFKKIQPMTDKSIQRVQELQKEIEAAEAQNQGTTNAIPTPPTP